jgi:hypothetical protein
MACNAAPTAKYRRSRNEIDNPEAQMRNGIFPAIIIASALLVSGFLVGGRYQIILVRGNELVRMDRYTGETEMCISGSGCGFIAHSEKLD